MNDPAQLEAAEIQVESHSRYALGREFWMIFAASCALNLVGNLFVMFPLWLQDLGGSATMIGAVVCHSGSRRPSLGAKAGGPGGLG